MITRSSDLQVAGEASPISNAEATSTGALYRLNQGTIKSKLSVVDWGACQHALHARVAPVRAAEYGIPTFRVASSGISQLVDARGHTVASAPCPGDGAMLSGVVEIRNKGHLPLDRWLAPFATVVTGAAIFLALIRRQSVTRTLPLT